MRICVENLKRNQKKRKRESVREREDMAKIAKNKFCLTQVLIVMPTTKPNNNCK